MKKLLIVIMLTLSLATYGQEQPRVVEKYEKHNRVDNLLTRWYYDLVGTSTSWKEQLTLYDDYSYRYVYTGGECATFDRDEVGSWEKTEDSLFLSSGQRYVRKDNKLYLPATPINQKTWVMKVWEKQKW
jgi:hypothetical protein